ncbi:Lymphocyte antigen 6E [Varanus komodoensis]|uniref:lymphocyte antigen 6E-like n=1 Tax=Varanus komodoensis TaxID=61221 RepID=UPI001CF7DBFB|nr:lymphocyte antigen 6E-like [Varanus komodoensis]KAF7237211.1 Lymphocyte antigen 6E [Varanus komodoensis]
MKTLLTALLVAILCMGKVHALWCYRCENEPSNWNCIKLVKCAETDSYCSTTVTTSRQGKDTDYRLSKGCAPTCTENNMVTSLGSVSTSCCQRYGCNFSGATSVKTSSAVMVVGILASFFYIFRSGL